MVLWEVLMRAVIPFSNGGVELGCWKQVAMHCVEQHAVEQFGARLYCAGVGGTSALAAVIVSAGVFPAPHFETDFGAGVCVDVDGVSMSVPIYPLILVVWVKTLLKSKGVDMNCSRLVFLMCVWRWSCSPCILP